MQSVAERGAQLGHGEGKKLQRKRRKKRQRKRPGNPRGDRAATSGLSHSNQRRGHLPSAIPASN